MEPNATTPLASAGGLHVEVVPIGTLMPDPRNVRRHSKRNLMAIRASLKRWGQRKPIVVDADGIVRAGNGTLAAALELGWTELAVVRAELRDAEARAFAIADNRTAELASWSDGLDEMLAELDIAGVDLSAVGFSEAELARLVGGTASETETPEPPAAPVTQPGDLWLLGQHRLLCADSGDTAAVARLMGNDRAVLLATDPPYGVEFGGKNYNPRAKAWAPIAGDDVKGLDYVAWLSALLQLWRGYCEPDAAYYTWCGALDSGLRTFEAIKRVGLHIQAQIIWAKNVHALGQADYQWRHEYCWYAFVQGTKHRWLGGRAQTTLWEVAKDSNASYRHPTQKPVELFARPIRNHTQPGEIVAEPFAGSGSQVLAAEQLGRRCFAMELEPGYCDVVVQRWEELSGGKAQRALDES